MRQTCCLRTIHLCLLFIILVRASKQDSTIEENDSEDYVSLRHDHDCEKLEGSDEGTYEVFSEDEIQNNERTNYKKAIKSVLCWIKIVTTTYNAFGHELNQTIKYGLSVETSDVFVGEHIVFPEYIRRNVARENQHPPVIKQIYGHTVTEERLVTCKHKYKVLGDGGKTGGQKVEVWIRPEHSNEVILNPLVAHENCSQNEPNENIKDELQSGSENSVSTPTAASTTTTDHVTASPESDETESCDDDMATEIPSSGSGHSHSPDHDLIESNLFPVSIVKITPPAQVNIKCELVSKHVVAIMCPDKPRKLPIIDEFRLPSDVKLTFTAIMPKLKSPYDVLVKGKQSCYYLQRHSEIMCPKSTKKMFTIYMLRKRVVTTPVPSISDATTTPTQTTTTSNKTSSKPGGSAESQVEDSTKTTPTVLAGSTAAPTTPASKLFTARIIDFVREKLPVCYFVDSQILRGPCPENDQNVLHLLSLKLPKHIEAVNVISMPENHGQYLCVKKRSLCYYLKKVELINCTDASPELINLMKMPEISDATTTMAPDWETKTAGETTTTAAPTTVFRSKPIVQLIDHDHNEKKSRCRKVDSHVYIIKCPQKLNMYRVDETTMPGNIDISYLGDAPDTTTKNYIFAKGAIDCFLFQIIKNVDCNIIKQKIVFHRESESSTPTISEPTEEPTTLMTHTYPITEKKVEISETAPKVTQASEVEPTTASPHMPVTTVQTTETITDETEEPDNSGEISLRMLSMIDVDAKGNPQIGCKYVSPYVISVRCPKRASHMYNFLKYTIPPGFFIVNKKSHPFLLSHRYVPARGLHSCYLFRKIQDAGCPDNIKDTVTLYKQEDNKGTSKLSIKKIIEFIITRPKTAGTVETISTTQQYSPPTQAAPTTRIYKTTATSEPGSPEERKNTRTTRSSVTFSDESSPDLQITESVFPDLDKPIPTPDLKPENIEKLPKNNTFIIKLTDVEPGRTEATQCKRVHRYVLTIPCPKDTKNFYKILDVLPTVANKVKTKIIPKRLLHRALFARTSLRCHVFISLKNVNCSKHEKDAVNLIKTPLVGSHIESRSSEELRDIVTASTEATTFKKPEPSSITPSYSNPTTTHFKQTTPTTTVELSTESTVHIAKPSVPEFPTVTLAPKFTEMPADSSQEDNLSDSKPVVTYNPEHTITVRLIKIYPGGHRKERCKITKKYIMSLVCPRRTDQAYLLHEHEAPRKVKFIRLQVLPKHLTTNFIFAKGMMKCYLIEKLANIPCPKSMKDTFNLIKFKKEKYVEHESKPDVDVSTTQPPPTKSSDTTLPINKIPSTHGPNELPVAGETTVTSTPGQPAANSSESESSESEDSDFVNPREYYEGFRIRLIEISSLNKVRVRCKLVFSQVITAECPSDTKNFYYVNETQVRRFARLNNFRQFPRALTHVRSVALAKGDSDCYVFKALRNIKCPISVDKVLNLFKVQDGVASAALVDSKGKASTERTDGDFDQSTRAPSDIFDNSPNNETTSRFIPPTPDYSLIKVPPTDTFILRLIDPSRDKDNFTCKVVYKNVIKSKCPKGIPQIYHIRRFRLPERVNVIPRKNITKFLKFKVIIGRGKHSCYVFMDLGGTQCSRRENIQNLYKPFVKPKDEEHDSVIRIDNKKDPSRSSKQKYEDQSEDNGEPSDAVASRAPVILSTSAPLQVFTEYSPTVPVTDFSDLVKCADISIVKIIDLHRLGRAPPVFKVVKRTVHSVSCSTIMKGQYTVHEPELRKNAIVVAEPINTHRASGRLFYAKSGSGCYVFEELPSTKCPVSPYNLIILYRTFTWTYKKPEKMKITRLPSYVAYETLTKHADSTQPSSRPVVVRLVDIKPQQDVNVICVAVLLNVLVIKCPRESNDFYSVQDSQLAEKTHLFYLMKPSKLILSQKFMMVKGQEQCYLFKKIGKVECPGYDDENLINMYRFGYTHSINLPLDPHESNTISLEYITSAESTSSEEFTTPRPAYNIVWHTTPRPTFTQTKGHDLILDDFTTTSNPGSEIWSIHLDHPNELATTTNPAKNLLGESSVLPAPTTPASSEESHFDESIEGLWNDDETSAEAQKPMIVKHKSHGRVFCYIIDASIKMKRINCPPDTSKIPRIVNPHLIKMICRRKIQNYHNNLRRKGLLMKYNLLKYDEES